MATKTTKIYLSYLNGEDKQTMTNAMAFLRTGGSEGKQELLDVARELYGEGVKLDMQWDNGRYPTACGSRGGDKHYTTIVDFEKKHLTEQAIKALGEEPDTRFSDFRYYYTISLGDEDRQLYLLSLQDRYSPNWNGNYDVKRRIPLADVDFPVLTAEGTVYRMDDALHGAINRRRIEGRPLFVESEGRVQMTVGDQHGNYTVIEGDSVEQVFRNYADNYTGYRNYRRQMASEWEISDPGAKARYDEWVKTATGLKSDFDKFYGGGIVD